MQVSFLERHVWPKWPTHTEFSPAANLRLGIAAVLEPSELLFCGRWLVHLMLFNKCCCSHCSLRRDIYTCHDKIKTAKISMKI